MLAIYEEAMGVKVGFGVAFNKAEGFTDGDVTLDSFALTGIAKRPNLDAKFGALEYKVTYENNEKLEQNLAAEIIIAVYVIELDASENETITFVNRGEGEYNGFDSVSYNYALENSN